MVVRRAFAAAYSVFFDLDELPINMQQKLYIKKFFHVLEQKWGVRP